MTRYFTQDHEWIDVDGSDATVGITDYAQSQLGRHHLRRTAGGGFGGGQGRQRLGGGSVKAASDVYAPVSGTVSEANAALEDEPELVNTAPKAMAGCGA
jgi:glycine cleavage system H protein